MNSYDNETKSFNTVKRKPVISLVITTYNGSSHILTQLESLRNQTVQPDEVLIFDDLSTDNTTDIIGEYIQSYQLTTWKIQINSTRLGWKRNFMDGIRKATGDLIFLCDQDDRWYPDKIERMVDGIALDNHILLLSCDYNVIYEPGAILSKVYRKKRREEEGLVAKYEFKTNFFMNPKPGCSYVLRKSFFDDVNSLWFEGAHHDEFLWLMATIQDGAFFYNVPLMDYIRYCGNSSEIRFKDINMQMENLTYIEKMLSQMNTFAEKNPDKVTEEKKKKIEKAQIWCGKRQQLIKSRNPILWILLMPWWGYYNSPVNCLSDLYLVIFGKFRRKAIS